jgi:FAD dependent oxidoreductase TIGR03364
MHSGVRKTGVAIVGGGMLGLAHACLAARAGRSVTVFERSPAPVGASIRNFGLIWPIGQPPGTLHDLALRSRELWLSILQQAALPFLPTGSLHAAYHVEEAAVGNEFVSLSGYDCKWLNAAQTIERSPALREEGLLGALWSPSEMTVDPRIVIAQLTRFLRDTYDVRFFFNTMVHRVEPNRLFTDRDEWNAETIVICASDDFRNLFPERHSELGLTRCKLQMLRTVAQPQEWRLGPALAFGLTFRHYPAFEICSSLPALRARIARENPEFDQWGIHVMASQTAAGEITIGDSHEYGAEVNIFDRPVINQLILDYARQYLRLPSFEIAQQWHGVYPKHPSEPFTRFTPASGVHVVAVTSGIGMTLSFGLGEETWREMQ